MEQTAQPIPSDTKLDQVPEKAPGKEELLDTLLDCHEHMSRAQATSAKQKKADHAAAFRKRLTSELLPSLELFLAKYKKRGVSFTFETKEFLAGGNQLAIEIRFAGIASRLEGTLVSGRLAFLEMRRNVSSKGTGAFAPGPELRIRNITCQEWKNFIATRTSIVVREAIRSKRVRVVR